MTERDEYDDLVNDYHGLEIERDRLRADNERLRAAFLKIAEIELVGPDFEEIKTARDIAFDALSSHEQKSRCAVTGNLCGTDTRPVANPCQCGPCQQYTREQKASNRESS